VSIRINIDGSALQKLTGYLENHEEDIQDCVNDFGDLTGVLESIEETI